MKDSVYICSCFFVNFSIVNGAFSDFPTPLPKKRAAATKEKRSSMINNEVRTTLVIEPMFTEEYVHNLPNEIIPIN
uniref:Uncharacterized protein n=1 Tax=Caenorhabditis japonica TaxID=281687 RepID=A0A8R1HMD2_CAEJA